MSSGGVYPGKVHGNLDGYGIDCIIQAGGGVHGYPDGTTAGARAMVQAAEAWRMQIPSKRICKRPQRAENCIEILGFVRRAAHT